MAECRGARATVALIAAVLIVPFAAAGQEATKVWRIGVLSPYSMAQDSPRLAALRAGLKDLGYVEGKNLVVDYRPAEGRFERLPALAAEVARLPWDVLVAHGDAAVPARQATATMPIVFVANPDPIGMGIATSLARPGGNATGLSDLHSELVAKRLTFLKQALPSASRFGVVWNSRVPAHPSQLREIQTAAPALRITIVPVEVTGPQEFSRAFTTIKKEGVEAVTILGGATGAHRRQFAALAIQHRVPTISTTREFAEDGLLMSYGSDFSELYRRAATYVHRIVKGAKPGDLPIEQPTNFDLVINMKTANALGLTIPPALLVQAAAVIR